MEKQIMQAFLESIKNQDYQDLKYFKEMLEKLPQARAEAVKARYEANPEKIKPFKKVWIYEDKHGICTVLDDFMYEVNGETFHVAINAWVPDWGELNSFTFDIFIRGKEKEIIKEKLAFLRPLVEWGVSKDIYERYVNTIEPIRTFGEATQKLYDFLDHQLFPKLNEMVKRPPTKIQLLSRNQMKEQYKQKFIKSLTEVEKYNYQDFKRSKEILEKLAQARAEAVKAHYEKKENRGIFDTVKFGKDKNSENWYFVDLTGARHKDIKIGVTIWTPVTCYGNHFQVDCYFKEEIKLERSIRQRPWKNEHYEDNWEEIRKHFEFCEKELRMQWMDEHKKYKKIIYIELESSAADPKELYDFVDDELLPKLREQAKNS